MKLATSSSILHPLPLWSATLISDARIHCFKGCLQFLFMTPSECENNGSLVKTNSTFQFVKREHNESHTYTPAIYSNFDLILYEYNQDFLPSYDSDLLILNNATYSTLKKLLVLLLHSVICFCLHQVLLVCRLTPVSISPLSVFLILRLSVSSLLSDFLVTLLISPLLNIDLHPSLLSLRPVFTLHLYTHKLRIIASTVVGFSSPKLGKDINYMIIETLKLSSCLVVEGKKTKTNKRYYLPPTLLWLNTLTLSFLHSLVASASFSPSCLPTSDLSTPTALPTMKGGRGVERGTESMGR